MYPSFGAKYDIEWLGSAILIRHVSKLYSIRSRRRHGTSLESELNRLQLSVIRGKTAEKATLTVRLRVRMDNGGV